MADTDWLTLDEGKAAVNFDEDISDKDDEIAALISGVSEAGDDLCGPVVARTVTEYHSSSNGSLFPYKRPVLSVTSITEYDAAGVGTVLSAEDHDTKPADGYLLISEGHFARIYRRNGGSAGVWASGDRNIAVIFEAGRCTSTETVPYKFKRAAKAVMAREWRKTSPAWARSQDLPETDEYGLGISLEDMIRAELSSELINELQVG